MYDNRRLAGIIQRGGKKKKGLQPRAEPAAAALVVGVRDAFHSRSPRDTDGRYAEAVEARLRLTSLSR